MTLQRSVHLLHALEKDGLGLKDRAIYMVENAAEAAKLVSYATRFPEEEAAHMADLKLAVGDVMVQAAMLCLDAGWNPRDILDLGIAHVYERFQDFARRGWQ